MAIYTRKMDEVGRIVLSLETRQRLNIAVGEDLDIYDNGEKIIIEKHSPACIFCGSKEELKTLNHVKYCQSCKNKITQRLKEGGK